MECKTSSLCIFDTPSVQTDFQRTSIVDYYPLNSVNGVSPIEFHIPGNSEDYLDLNDIRLYLKLKVAKVDGSPIAATDKVG